MMNRVTIKTEYIKLGQFMKYVGIIGNGAEAKDAILTSKVLVNGEHETRRGRKLYPGYSVSVDNKEYCIENDQD